MADLVGTMVSLPPIILGTSAFAGALSWPVGILEPAVAGYALRLYRHLGTRVGWWVFASFCLLALAHSLQFWGPAARVVGPSISFDLIAFLVPLLLLIGMAHTETTFSDRARAERNFESLRQRTQTNAEQKANAAVREIEVLRDQVARYGEREKALEDSVKQYSLLFMKNPQPMWVFDLRSLQILAMNRLALAQYGLTSEECSKKTARDLIPERSIPAFLADVAQPAPDGQSRGVWLHRRIDGTLLEVEVSAIDLRYADCPARLVLASDITCRRQAESRLRQESNLEAIGRVVGTLAVHYENLMTTIAAETQALLNQPQDLANSASLKQISGAVTRAAVITQQLLTAGARRAVKIEDVELNRLLLRLEPMLRQLLGSAVELQSRFCPSPACVKGDVGLLEHIVVNLLLNARNAISWAGKVTVQTSIEVLREDSSPPVQRSGEWVCLRVRDTGCGISQEVQARLFEPFCPADVASSSMGLGLASTYGAVKQLSGWIEIDTEAAVGTEVRVYLPLCRAEQPAVAPTAPTTPGRSADSKTILLVEPDSRMRMMARSVLEWKGYHVIETDSASLALIIWPTQGQAADLLLTDITLPGDISGFDLAGRLRTEKPGLKVLFSCEPDRPPAISEQLKNDDLIQKPFTSVELLERVTNCLPEN